MALPPCLDVASAFEASTGTVGGLDMDTPAGDGGTEAAETVDAGPLPPFRQVFGVARPPPWRGGDMSEGPSESSVNIEDTEDDDFQSTIPNLERFYEQLAAKAKLPERHGTSASSWVLSLARGYRRLSKEKRRHGSLRALLQPAGRGRLSATSCSGLPCPMVEQPGCSSNTDDSGYEAGYETDADESELSEWENGSASQRQQRHKRKLDALVHLTMKLSVSEGGEESEEKPIDGHCPPPLKQHRALGTQPVGLRLPLPHATPVTLDSALSGATRITGIPSTTMEVG